MTVAEKAPGDYVVDAGNLSSIMAERCFNKQQLDGLVGWLESATGVHVSVDAHTQYVHSGISEALFIRLSAGSVERPASSNGSVFPAREYFESLGVSPIGFAYYQQWSVDGHYVARAISELPHNVRLCVEVLLPR